MPVSPLRKLLLGVENQDGTVTGVTTGTSLYIQLDSTGLATVYLRSIGTTSGGTVIVEEADWGPLEMPYSGTWSQLSSQAASGFTGGAQLAVHVVATAYSYVRVRISSAITGGGTIIAVLRAVGGAS